MATHEKSKMLSDLQFRRSPNCSKFSLLVSSRDSSILDYQFVSSVSGKELNDEYFLQNGFNFPILMKDPKENIDLKLPPNVKTLNDIARIIGPDFQVKIIDVGAQHEIEGWTIRDYAQYLEQRGKMHKVLNMITLETSGTPLTSQLLAPTVVRNTDWIDMYWPFSRRARGGDYPRVQKYVLAGMAGSYTDFHVDFGGTSVWYHVLVGEKVFYVIPPSEANLRAYRSWISSANQDEVYFPDTLSDKQQCKRITIKAGQTLFLPSGWIHSVYTPADSLVYGGNFLLSSCILHQLQVYHLEQSSRIPRKYLFPYYKQMAWYVVCCSLERYRHDRDSSSLPPPYPSILQYPLVAFQWIYLIKTCEIWISDETQLLDDKLMFESIACECYGLSEDSLETTERSLLPSRVIQDWWAILESHPFTLSEHKEQEQEQTLLSAKISCLSSSESYLSSLRHHIQTIRQIPHRDFDVLNEEIFASDPLHETYRHDYDPSQPLPLPQELSPEPSLDPHSKPEMKIRLKLKPASDAVPPLAVLKPEEAPEEQQEEEDCEEEEKEEEEEEETKPKPSIKLKLTLSSPPAPSSGRSRRAIPPPPSSEPAAPLSRTRGKRLPLSFLQSVTDIDVELTSAAHAADEGTRTEGRGGEGGENEGDEDWLVDEDEEDGDFLDDQEAQEQIRTDHISDFLEEEEYDGSASASGSGGGSSRKRRQSSGSGGGELVERGGGTKKAKAQKLGPGALLRKRLSGKYL